jgi:hypothetical protein
MVSIGAPVGDLAVGVMSCGCSKGGVGLNCEAIWPISMAQTGIGAFSGAIYPANSRAICTASRTCPGQPHIEDPGEMGRCPGEVL